MPDPVDEWIRLATEDGIAEAAARLTRDPSLGRASLYAACVAGEAEAAHAFLSRDPGLARSAGGPEQASPLIYVCFSGFLRTDARRAGRLVEIARQLLQLGADPNAVVVRGPVHQPMRLSALYGAAGRANHAELTALLLQAGANPNDNESLYHATEFRDHRCLKLLLAHGATIPGSNAVHRQLDYDDLEGLRILLDHGADPNLRRNGNDEPLIHWAIQNGRGVEFLELLADRGADLTARDARGRTAYLLAVMQDHCEAVEFLEQRGASTPLPPAAQTLRALLYGSEVEAREALGRHPDLIENLHRAHSGVLAELAWRGRTSSLARLLGLGFPVGATDGHGATPLHNAAWRGDRASIEALLPYHPPLEPVEFRFHATPLQWALHGARCAKDGEGRPLNPTADYPAVVRALVRAGARVADGMSAEVESILGGK